VRYDIVAEDARGRDVLLVEVKAMPLDDQQALAQLAYMREAQLPVRFAMVVDPEKIRVVDYERGDGAGFACVLGTKDVLTTYDPNLGSKKRIFGHYLATLVDAWIRDHVYHWKSQTPPAAEALASVGLLPLLSDGDTRRGVIVETDLLR
jgi:hypothetical protein